jgi:hypothetical protein
MRPLRLLKQHSRYNAGEIAGFEETEAARLIANKIAEAYVPEGAAPAAEDKAPEPKPLADLTKAELVELAKAELGLDLDKDEKKDVLIAAIQDARDARAAS